MNILITGVTGFIGKNFLKQIKNNNWFPESTIYLLSSQNIDEHGFVNIQ